MTKVTGNKTKKKITRAEKQEQARKYWADRLPANYAEFEDGYWSAKFYFNQMVANAEEKPGEGAINAEAVNLLATQMFMDMQDRLKPALDAAADEADK